MDTADGNITSQIVVTSSLPASSKPAGTYSIVYTASDTAGNRVSVTRTVTLRDVTKPQLRLYGYETLEYVRASPWIDPGFSAVDAVDGDVASSVIISNLAQLNASAFGSEVQLVYSVKDKANNIATVTRTVVVIEKLDPSPSSDASSSSSTASSLSSASITLLVILILLVIAVVVCLIALRRRSRGHSRVDAAVSPAGSAALILPKVDLQENVLYETWSPDK